SSDLAPLATVAGWSFVLYMSVFVAWRIRARSPLVRRSSFISALIAASIALAFDLALDPTATALGSWSWNPILPIGFGGVPVMNYVAWFSVVFAFAFSIFAIQTRLRIDDGSRWPIATVIRFALATPIVFLSASALFFAAMSMIEGP